MAEDDIKKQLSTRRAELKRDVKKRARGEFWCKVFKLKKLRRGRRDLDFAGHVRTDGVSISVLFDRLDYSSVSRMTKNRRKAEKILREATPDELAMQRIIGIDPGRRSICYATEEIVAAAPNDEARRRLFEALADFDGLPAMNVGGAGAGGAGADDAGADDGDDGGSDDGGADDGGGGADDAGADDAGADDGDDGGSDDDGADDGGGGADDAGADDVDVDDDDADDDDVDDDDADDDDVDDDDAGGAGADDHDAGGAGADDHEVGGAGADDAGRRARRGGRGPRDAGVAVAGVAGVAVVAVGEPRRSASPPELQGVHAHARLVLPPRRHGRGQEAVPPLAQAPRRSRGV